MIALLGCGEGLSLDTAVTTEVVSYDVLWSTDPAPALAAQEVVFTAQVVDQEGRPVPDLQSSHERLLHTVFVSRDLASFQHLHHEDFEAVGADDLRNATLHFPVTFAAAGDMLVSFDFAHHNRFQHDEDWLVVQGSPVQAATPSTDLSGEATVGDHVGTLAFKSPPTAGAEAQMGVTIRTVDGLDVTDIVPWLGADGHAFLARDDLSWSTHTHAWVEGLDAMSPNMTMPHVYDGPVLDFRVAVPDPGTYALWVQFARSADPDAPFTLPFAFEVIP